VLDLNFKGIAKKQNLFLQIKKYTFSYITSDTAVLSLGTHALYKGIGIIGVSPSQP